MFMLRLWIKIKNVSNNNFTRRMRSRATFVRFDDTILPSSSLQVDLERVAIIFVNYSCIVVSRFSIRPQQHYTLVVRPPASKNAHIVNKC